MNRLLLLLSFILPLTLGYFLLRRFQSLAPELSVKTLKASFSKAVSLGFIVCAVGLSVTPTDDAMANVSVDNDILKQLEQRLTAPPRCIPNCLAIEKVQLTANKQKIEIEMTVNSEADLALPLPALWNHWWPNSVVVNGQKAAILQSRNNQLYIRLKKGQHLLSMVGDVGKGETVELPFQLPIHNVSFTLEGWSLRGLPSATQASQSLQLIRDENFYSDRVKAQKDKDQLLPEPISPYVIITRKLDLGLEWTVTTYVERVAPQSGSIHLAIPLLKGEAPNSGVVNSSGEMEVRLNANQHSSQWQSSLKIDDVIELMAEAGKPWAEVWLLQTSELWHSVATGIPAIARESQSLAPMWQPWPGEKVSVQVTRPIAIAGRQLGIDSVRLEQRLGKRADDVSVTFKMRATQGGQYDFNLPANSLFKGVQINGSDFPISHSGDHLKIPIKPGEHTIRINWQNDTEKSSVLSKLLSQTPAMNLKEASSNIHINMQLPHDRWLLAVGGPAMGPAILFWGVLAVVLILAIALGRSRLTPLKAYEWVLLSLGICTFNLYVLMLIAGWLIVLKVRGAQKEPPVNTRFNLLQVALFVLSVISLMCLASSIPMSLLARPDMMVVGNGSSATNLLWYQDQSVAELPQAWAISLPIMAYRIAMLAWSLWLAFSLMRWIPWAWAQLGVHGYWYTADKTIEEPNEGDKG